MAVAAPPLFFFGEAFAVSAREPAPLVSSFTRRIWAAVERGIATTRCRLLLVLTVFGVTCVSGPLRVQAVTQDSTIILFR